MPRSPDEMQDQLDRLGHKIEATREKAEDDDLLPEDDVEDREPTLADPNVRDADDDGLPGSATG